MIESAAFSRLGFGVTGPHASLAGHAGRTRQLVREAIACGITYFDTGPAYGHGRGEARLGAALNGIPRETVFVSTKAGIHPGGIRDFSPGAIEMSLKASLERLSTPYIDLLLLHGPAPEELTPKLLRHLEAFRTRGLFRHLGLCGRGPELEAAAGIAGMDAIMAPLYPELEADALERLERLKSAGLSLIAIEALKGATQPVRLPLTPSSAWYFARSIKQALTGQRAAPSGRTPAQALSWALDHPLANSVMSLTTQSSHLHENARLAGLEPASPAS